MRRAILSRAIAVIVAALFIAGCPGGKGEDESQNAPPKADATSTQNPQATPENSVSMNPVAPPQAELPGNRIPAAATQVIRVLLTEYEIQMPDTLPAGRQTLEIVNGGKMNHNFSIEGNGVAAKLANNLTRGDTTQLVVDLKPGTYRVWCPVDGHKGKGMERTGVVK